MLTRGICRTTTRLSRGSSAAFSRDPSSAKGSRFALITLPQKLIDFNLKIFIFFRLFSRLILESPFITTNAIQILRSYCQEEVSLDHYSSHSIFTICNPANIFDAQNRIYLGMSALKELILKRPPLQLEFLDVLLDFTSHETLDVSRVRHRMLFFLSNREKCFSRFRYATQLSESLRNYMKTHN